MAKLTKTELKVRMVVAHAGIADMTVAKQHLDNGDIEALEKFVNGWLGVYTEQFEKYIAELEQA